MNVVSKSLRYAWSSRRAWWFTATARTKARFARTALGGFWLGLSNLFSIAALAIVYGTVFGVQDFSRYVVYLGTGLVIWNAIAAAIGSAPSLFEYNAGRLKNTNINPIFYTLEEWAFQVQTFVQSFGLVLLALSVFQPTLYLHFFRVGLLPMLNLLLFIYWVPLIICLIGARYRDLFQLVPIALQLLFLVSPILYQRKNLGSLVWMADFNPFYRLLSPFRHALIEGEFKAGQSFLILAVNLAGIWIALVMLDRQRRYLPFLV
ncbi:ABC transporter permease [Synechococcus sp. CS-1328]|uniref:ABC transporter permease n=1 Tax=Synechococcus sp. CS-1328 TaxID=2847976 RepID=UPI00223B15AE|nr:ABC transporter permease [Synechococcus sp. CS-1328]MCT0224988.1 ABC transporter permease [Synechococcus sp. CS-1328]